MQTSTSEPSGTGQACLRERFASLKVAAQRTWCDILRLGLRLWKVLTARPISHAGLFKWYALGGRQRRAREDVFIRHNV